MPQTKGQNFQDVNQAALPVMGKVARTSNEDLMAAIDLNFDSPLRIYAASTPDAKLYFRASQILASDGSGKSISPQGSSIPAFVASNIDFQLQTTSGGTFDVTFPTSTVGQYRRVGFTLQPTGTLKATFSAESGTIGGLVDPATLFITGQQVGWIDLECTDVSGKFKTAGSATNIIENAVGGVARIVRFGVGGGGGGGVADKTIYTASGYADGSSVSDCTITTVSDKTRVTISGFTYNTALFVGKVKGDLQVLVNGQLIERKLTGVNDAIVDNVIYDEVSGTQVDIYKITLTGTVELDANQPITIIREVYTTAELDAVAGHIIPVADDTYDLGSPSNRWRTGYFGPTSVHIGSEGVLSYDETNKKLQFIHETGDTPANFGSGGAAGINTVEVLTEQAKLHNSNMSTSIEDYISEPFIESDTNRVALTNTAINLASKNLYLTSTNLTGSVEEEIYLKSIKSGGSIEWSVRYNTNTFFDCNAGTSTTESKLASVGSDRDAEIYSGTTSYGWFVLMKRTGTSLPWKQADLGQRVSITAASYASDVITVTHSALTGTIPAPTSTAKYVFVLENAQPIQKSIADETYVDLTPSKIKVFEDGLAYPSYVTGYWKMNAASGGEINSKETSGTYDLIQTGTVPSVSGKLNGARGTYTNSNYFITTNTLVATPMDKVLFGVEFWFKHDGTSSGSDQQWVNKKGSVSGWSVSMSTVSLNRISFGLGDGGSMNYITPAASYNDNIWHHVFVVNRATSGSNEARVYIDTVNVGSDVGRNMSPSLSQPMFVGRDYDGDPALYTLIDNIAYHDYVTYGTPSWVQIEAMMTASYNLGLGRIYGSNFGYNIAGILEGQSAAANAKLELKAGIRREDTTTNPTLEAISLKF